MTMLGTESVAHREVPTILIVDDNTILRTLLHRGLTSAGYRVAAVGDGRAAQRLIASGAIHLVLTDVYASDGEGTDLVTYLQSAAPALPVIVMTTGFRGMENSILRAMHSLSGHRTLEKPFTLQALLDAVQETLKPTIR